MRYGYPLVLRAAWQKVQAAASCPWMTALLAVFMAVNMGLTSALALARYDARTSGEGPAKTASIRLPRRPFR